MTREERSEKLVAIAKIETALMVEFLSSSRPHYDSAIWVRNAPRGPSVEGIEAVRAVQGRYGFSHVTTGNPRPLDKNLVGIYVSEDALRRDNPVRWHLSRHE